MTPRQSILQRYRQWWAKDKLAYWSGVNAFIQDSHACWMPTPNRYVQHDIGTKNIRYPDGKTRSVRVTKVRDTGGVTFYSFASDTPLI